jgi:hypothetical protein
VRRDLTRATMLDSWYSLTRIGVGFLVYPVSFRPRSQPAGHEMNLYGARSEKFLLVGLALSVAIVGVLTTLVIHQEHDPSTVADAPARTAPQPVLAPTARQLAPAPPVTAPPSPPALVTPAPGIATPTQLAPSSPKPLKATTLPHRRGNPVPAPPPAAATHPIAPPPPPADPAPAAKPGSPDGWDPVPAARSHSPVKPGSPDGW